MLNYERIFSNNKNWATLLRETDPTYFQRQAAGQEPHFFLIGCCDSRVPTELLTGARPGEIFTHRNIANQAHPNDLSMLSALEYAVEVLDVMHVVILGHYGCGGVKAATGTQGHGVVDHWLHVIRDVYRWHAEELQALPDTDARIRRLVELNVLEQVYQISRTPVIQRAWEKGKRPMVHGLVYDIQDGILRELVTGLDSEAQALMLRARVSGPTSVNKP